MAVDRGRFQDEQSQPRCWRNLWHPNKDFHLMRAMPRVPVKARLIFVLNRLDSRNGIKDQRITSVLFRFRILGASPPKKLPKHGGSTISTISKPKHFSIYSCKTSYTSSTVQPKILPILFPRHLQDVGLHELPKLAAWLPSHESSLNVRCYLPWEKICRKHVASKGFHSTLKNQTTKLVNWLWRDLRKPYQTRSQEESKIQIH